MLSYTFNYPNNHSEVRGVLLGDVPEAHWVSHFMGEAWAKAARGTKVISTFNANYSPKGIIKPMKRKARKAAARNA